MGAAGGLATSAAAAAQAVEMGRAAAMAGGDRGVRVRCQCRSMLVTGDVDLSMRFESDVVEVCTVDADARRADGGAVLVITAQLALQFTAMQVIV